MPNWDGHFCKCGEVEFDMATEPPKAALQGLRERIEPWLAALMQSEHLSLLVGNGLTTATSYGLGTNPAPMSRPTFGCTYADKVRAYAESTAKRCERGKANLEDDFRAAQILIEALTLLEDEEAAAWEAAYSKALRDLIKSVLDTERGIEKALADKNGEDTSGLLDLLLSFANRPPTRERLELFTTNYDRLIEHACDSLGIRILDRFVGVITPQFRASRLSVDLHYDPPGIRGEPRYLEGVIRLTKLHGSLDWRLKDRAVFRTPLPFGPAESFPTGLDDPYRSLMIYPNAAKDVETLAFPYAELFRDFVSATCRPNATLFVYGYGFGDDHINRVIREMLTISSTHLVIVSFDNCDGRLQTFVEKSGHEDQVSLLVGGHFAGLRTLTDNYLPRTLVEPLRQRKAAIASARGAATPTAPSATPVPATPATPTGDV